MSRNANLAEILARIADGLCVFDEAGQLTFANEKASQLLAEADDVFHGRISRLRKERTSSRFEHFHLKNNRWFEHQTHPNADGGMTIFSRDVTSRHRLEEALRSSEERFRRVAEGSKILASSLECEKTLPELAEFIVANLADCCLIFVKEEGELRRMGVAYSVPASGSSEPDLDLDRVMNIGESEIDLKPVSRALVPIIARDEVVGVLAVISEKEGAFNVDDLQLFEELARRAGLALESARLYQETQRANRLKDEFVAIVSHELRTPLTPILGGIYMLRNEAHDERIFAKALDLIERNAKTQVKLVDDLLDISRIISGKLKLNIEAVDLAAVIQSAVEIVRPAGDAKGIQIDVRLGELNGPISGDADRIQQIVWNLLANSVKFTPTGGRITVELFETTTHAEIRVTDTGIGIHADFLPHVFERFRQADTTRTRVHGGLGLGLAIVRHLVESHGGTVHAESSGDEQGSTFIVRFPLRSIARVSGRN
jgi:signal transduction histidine kinase